MTEADGSRPPRRIAMACTQCRKRKVRCDGRRDRCSNCERRNATCTYLSVARQRSTVNVTSVNMDAHLTAKRFGRASFSGFKRTASRFLLHKLARTARSQT
ncbi:hypothetical protein BC629DRAFT_1231112 [Irpex lacteus]|nr:hypothetical protein BC629DRAFT_1231112 [Irpex lacteus]